MQYHMYFAFDVAPGAELNAKFTIFGSQGTGMAVAAISYDPTRIVTGPIQFASDTYAVRLDAVGPGGSGSRGLAIVLPVTGSVPLSGIVDPRKSVTVDLDETRKTAVVTLHWR